MKKKDRKNKRIRIHPLIKIVIFIGFIAGAYFFSVSSLFNVTAYEIEGNSYYSKEEILIMGDCKTGGNIFWDVRCNEIKDRLAKDAYMKEVKVKRILPDTVRIELTERKQTAAVVYGDNYVVVDGEHIVLRKTDIAPKLPLVQGVTISKLEVGQPIEIDEKVRFRQIMELIGMMEEEDMYFKTVVNSQAEVKAYVLDYLMCQGSPADLMESIEDGELQKVVRGLFDLGIERGTLKVSGGSYISFSPEIG